MKTRNKLILITIILFSGLVVIPTIITLGSTFYCNSINSADCVSYSISFIPNFRPALDEILGKEESQRQYDTTSATCNDILGKPDGQCFVKSLQECKHASIKNMIHTVEGDPVFYYAYIDVDDCQARYSVDLRQDRFAGIDNRDFHAFLCTDVHLNDYDLLFQCEDQQRILPLS